MLLVLVHNFIRGLLSLTIAHKVLYFEDKHVCRKIYCIHNTSTVHYAYTFQESAMILPQPSLNSHKKKRRGKKTPSRSKPSNSREIATDLEDYGIEDESILEDDGDVAGL